MNFVKRKILKGNSNNLVQICIYNKKPSNVLMLMDNKKNNIQINRYNAQGLLDTNTTYKSIADYYLGIFTNNYYFYDNKNKLRCNITMNIKNNIRNLSKVTHYNYNAAGRLTKKLSLNKYSEPIKEYTYEYDNYNRLIKECDRISNVTKRIDYIHGYKTEIIEHDDSIEFRYYNKYSKIDTIKIIPLNNSDKDRIFNYTYNELGQEIKLTMNNKVISEKKYDSKGRLIQDIASDLKYTYETLDIDPYDNIISILEFI